MNKSAFLKLIKEVSNISNQQSEELEKVAAAFPYYQTAHLLLAKDAYDKGSMLSTQRLRRASLNATDRQLLKRTIYTSPVPEPVYVAEPDAFDEPENNAAVLMLNAMQQLPSPAEIEETVEPDFNSDESTDLTDQDEHNVYEDFTEFEEVSDPDENTTSKEVIITEQPAELPQEEYSSELAMLLTINSLSSSYTDLLATTVPAEEEQPAVDAELNQEEETIAADFELEEDLTEVKEELPEVSFFEEDEEINSLQEEPEVKYVEDEFDRLYAEDSIGYWMGSSRMGEVLQLKDDYTRPKPQSFHPELILEYSKTHELEKAVEAVKPPLIEQLSIIDQFLKLNPRLKTMVNLKVKTEPQEDLSLKSTKIKKGLASESLATIFIKQGKPKKAVKIYEQLILKNPEKKFYFAEQIEKLQNLI